MIELFKVGKDTNLGQIYNANNSFLKVFIIKKVQPKMIELFIKTIVYGLLSINYPALKALAASIILGIISNASPTIP